MFPPAAASVDPRLLNNTIVIIMATATTKTKEKNIIIPTIAQMKNPNLIPDGIKEKLKNVRFVDETDEKQIKEL